MSFFDVNEFCCCSCTPPNKNTQFLPFKPSQIRPEVSGGLGGSTEPRRPLCRCVLRGGHFCLCGIMMPGCRRGNVWHPIGHGRRPWVFFCFGGGRYGFPKHMKQFGGAAWMMAWWWAKDAFGFLCVFCCWLSVFCVGIFFCKGNWRYSYGETATCHCCWIFKSMMTDDVDMTRIQQGIVFCFLKFTEKTKARQVLGPLTSVTPGKIITSQHLPKGAVWTLRDGK